MVFIRVSLPRVLSRWPCAAVRQALAKAHQAPAQRQDGSHRRSRGCTLAVRRHRYHRQHYGPRPRRRCGCRSSQRISQRTGQRRGLQSSRARAAANSAPRHRYRHRSCHHRGRRMTLTVVMAEVKARVRRAKGTQRYHRKCQRCRQSPPPRTPWSPGQVTERFRTRADESPRAAW